MKNILVVEDDKNIAKALEVRLRSSGYTPMIAHDAVMGIQSAVKNKPNLVIMDISIPGGDGLMVAERMSKLDETCDIPVIFLTATKKPGYKERAEELGAAAYFEKPYDANQLMGKVTQLI